MQNAMYRLPVRVIDRLYKFRITIDGIQTYKIVIATLFRHFEWDKYQKFPLHYVEIQ